MSKRFLAATGILKVYLPDDTEGSPTYSLTLPRNQAQDIIDGLGQQERFKHALYVFEQQEIMAPRPVKWSAVNFEYRKHWAEIQ